MSSPDPSTEALTRLRRSLREELYEDPSLDLRQVYLTWLFTGLLGGHRFAMGHSRRGYLMAMTVGGFFLWWIYEGIRLPTIVASFNEELADLQAQGELPTQLTGIQPVEPEDLLTAPSWAQSERPRGWLMNLNLAGMLFFVYAGSASASLLEAFEFPMLLLLICLVMLGRDQLVSSGPRRVSHKLLKWDYLLHSYYHQHRPRLFFKAILSAPFHLIAHLLGLGHSVGKIKLYLGFVGAAGTLTVLLEPLQVLLAVQGRGFDLGQHFLESILAYAMTLILVSIYAPAIGSTFAYYSHTGQTRRLRWCAGLTVAITLITTLAIVIIQPAV